MTMNELARWLEARDHQITLCLRKENMGLYIKMIDMKTGMIKMGMLSDYENEKSRIDLFKPFIDKMYQELMDALGRED